MSRRIFTTLTPLLIIVTAIICIDTPIAEGNTLYEDEAATRRIPANWYWPPRGRFPTVIENYFRPITPPSTPCTRGCDGVCNSELQHDCAGVCGGNAVEDSCGVCNGSGPGDCGCNLSFVQDACGLCPDELGYGSSDTDGDRVPNFCDNCPLTENPEQIDSNNNGIGDKCEDSNSCELYKLDIVKEGDDGLGQGLQLGGHVPDCVPEVILPSSFGS